MYQIREESEDIINNECMLEYLALICSHAAWEIYMMSTA